MQQPWQDRLERLAARHGVVGATLAVDHAGQVSEAATGVLNTRTGAPVTPASVFHAGSITKVWTATLILQLVDEGRLGLDDPVSEHLDTVLSEPSVTVRHLLSHSSGIDGDAFTDTGRGDDAVARFARATAATRPVFRPGASMSYSNAGYVLLGRVVELLEGRTWDACVHERLVRPLGLVTAGTLPEQALLHAPAVGHLPVDGRLQPVERWQFPRSVGPGGALHGTARDQLVFARAHLEDVRGAGRLLTAESAQQSTSAQVAVPDPYLLGSHWGLGWCLSSWDGTPVLNHDGATYGQFAFLRALPEHDLVVCLLTNGGPARALFQDLVGEVVRDLAGVELPRLPEPRSKPPDVDTAGWCGVYARRSARFEVTNAHNGGLQLRACYKGPLAELLGTDTTRRLVPFDAGTALVETGPSAWVPVVFHEVDGHDFLHTRGRASPAQ